jgi:hypothetical protein
MVVFVHSPFSSTRSPAAKSQDALVSTPLIIVSRRWVYKTSTQFHAFLNWRRAPLSLHNATDVNVIGNYFGPPITDDDLVPLANDVIADLWVSDYPNLRFADNVNATTLPNDATINEDGRRASVPVNAFQPPAAPQLAANLSGSNLVVSWVSLYMANCNSGMFAASKPHFKCPETCVSGYASPPSAASRLCDHGLRQLGARSKAR